MPKRRDITGQKFGRLTALEYVGRKQCGSKKPYHLWNFRCDCGNTVIRRIAHVLKGDTRSCGCLRRESWQKTLRKGLRKGESSFNGLYERYQYLARRRKCTWEINKELFRKLTKENCYYCGIAPYQSFLSSKSANGNYIYMGLDRILNDRGYSPENVVPCCKNCNWAKRTLSREEFLSLVKRIYEHQHRIKIRET